MKKALKISLKVLAGLAAAIIVALALAFLALNYIYSDTFKFYHASNHSDYETMEEMFNEGYDPNTDIIWGKPMSSFLLTSRLLDDNYTFDIDEAKYLLEHGVSPNINRTDWGSPLIYAVSSRHKPYVELLLEHKADINHEFAKHTPLDMAYFWRAEEIVRLLLQHNAELGDFAWKIPERATRIMYYYMRGITDERPVLQLINKNFHSREQLLDFFKAAQKQTNDFYKTENKDYDRKKVLEIIKNLEH